MLLLLPALGGLACGWLTRREPEARGGGGDVMIRAFHHGSALPPRLLGVKTLASIFTLGTGGAGGREGPTMLIGGVLGSLVARLLSVSARERRILLVAGVAAGIAAVFRTPLGAALLAVEVLYRDGFESDALVPSVLASVVSYSVVISIFGESTLLAHGPRFPVRAGPPAALRAAGAADRRPGHRLPVVAEAGPADRRPRLPGPEWMRPAWGGLALGLMAVPLVLGVGGLVGTSGQGFGIFGGGYGAAQVAITGAPWLPEGWLAVELLALLALAKLVAASFTIGSGGSAGDFAPSLAIGALLGGAFGRAAQLLLADPRIDPGAFALVGHGGVLRRHRPRAAVGAGAGVRDGRELRPAGAADADPGDLVRGPAQAHAVRGPGHHPARLARLPRRPGAGRAARDPGAGDHDPGGAHGLTFAPGTSTPEMLRRTRESTSIEHRAGAGRRRKDQRRGHAAAACACCPRSSTDAGWAIASDVMQAAVTVRPEADLRTAAELMVQHRLRVLLVVDGENGAIIGVLDESEIAKVYLRAAARADDHTQETRLPE